MLFVYKAKNRRRRERAALARQKKAHERSDGSVATSEVVSPAKSLPEKEKTDTTAKHEEHHDTTDDIKVDVEAEAAAAAVEDGDSNTISV